MDKSLRDGETPPEGEAPADETLAGEALANGDVLQDSGLNEQIMDALIELVKHLGNLGQAIGAEFGLHGSTSLALHKIDGPISMKELSLRLGCDASFITVVVDSLEKHGLARREPSLRDRRSKNIVLTEHGVAVRDQLTREITGRMPWCNALDMNEREAFLGLLRKMLHQLTLTEGQVEHVVPTGRAKRVRGGERVTPGVPISS